MLLACGASPPPERDATTEAVGVGERAEVHLEGVVLELPGEALSFVRLELADDAGATLELTLSGAPTGATTPPLADEVARSFELVGDGEVRRERVHVAGRPGILVTQGERRVVVVMRNPWRQLRIRAERRFSFAPGTRFEVAGVGLELEGWHLRRARFEAPRYAVEVEDEACEVRARPGRQVPEGLRVRCR